MEIFDEKIEQVILQKEYFELTPKEREQIADFISNEDDYAQFKMTLLMSSDIQTENIKPKAETKASLMQMMENSRPEKKVWYNSFIAFLFPEDRQAFAKPGVYISLAAVLAIVLLVVPFNFDQNASNQDMADKNTGESAEKDASPMTESEVYSEMSHDESAEGKDEYNDEILLNDQEDLYDDIKNTAILEEVNELEYSADNDDFISNNEIIDGKKKADLNKNDITIDYSAGVYGNAKGGNAVGGVALDSTATIVPAPGYYTNEVAARDKAYKAKTKDFISEDLAKESFNYEVLNDNGLNQNTDLIDLLYTAD